MICKNVSARIIDSFGYRRPDDSENAAFKTASNDFKSKGGAMAGSRSSNLGIQAALIERKFESVLQKIFYLPPPEICISGSNKRKVTIVMSILNQTLTDSFDRVIQTHRGPIVEFLDTTKSGIRTAVLITALNYKMLAEKLDSAFQDIKINFQELSLQGRETIKEIASVPQTILHSLVNYLCGRKLNAELKADPMIKDNSFDLKKFEFEEGVYGITEASVDEYIELHKKLCKENNEYNSIFLQSLEFPVFGCPAKRVQIKLEADKTIHQVNYIEAIQMLVEKKLSPVFCK